MMDSKRIVEVATHFHEKYVCISYGHLKRIVRNEYDAKKICRILKSRFGWYHLDGYSKPRHYRLFYCAPNFQPPADLFKSGYRIYRKDWSPCQTGDTSELFAAVRDLAKIGGGVRGYQFPR